MTEYSPGVRRAALPVTTFVQAASSAAVIGPTVAAPLLLSQLSLSAVAVGVYVALVYLGAMVATQLGAHVVRRLGPIRSSQLALLISAMGLLLMCVPQLPLVACGAWIIGLGYGPITPASSQMLSRTTQPRNFALVFSIKQTGVPLGGVLAGVVVPPLVLLGGAYAALVGVAVLCLLAALSAVPLTGELDRDRETHNQPWPQLAQLLAPMIFVARHPVLRSVALISFIFSMVQVSLTSYMVSLLTGDLYWTLAAAGAVLAVSQITGAAARIVWGLVADRWLGPRRMLMALGMGMVTCSLLTSMLSPTSPGPLVSLLLGAFGATAVGWNGVYLATVARLVPQAQAGTATSGTLFFTFFGVVIGPPIFGTVATALGSLASAFACLVLPLACGLFMLARARWP